MNALLHRFRHPLWALMTVYWLVLITLTHLPQDKLPKTKVSDKFAHFVIYGGLTTLLYLSLWPRFRSTLRLGLVVLVAVLTNGALDELTQPWFNRSCDIRDWLGDALGAISFILVLSIIRSLQATPQLLQSPKGG